MRPKAEMKTLFVFIALVVMHPRAMLIYEGAHSAIVGWQRLCLTPPLHEVGGCA